MNFEQPLFEGTIVRRYKSQADVRLRSGEEITAHCGGAGSLLAQASSGSRVLVSEVDDPHRRHKHQLEIVYAGRTAVGVNGGRPVTVVAEAIMQGKIKALAGYGQLRRDPKLARNHRIDIRLEGNALRTCNIMVQNVPLAEANVAYFPDRIMSQGMAHLDNLTNLVREGHRSVIFFVVQRADARSFQLRDDCDPDYAQAFRDAVARGVEILCHRSRVTRKGIELDKPLSVSLE